MKKVQILFFSVIALLTIGYTIGSFIQAGGFKSWHVGFIALSVITLLLVRESIKEYKQSNF